MLYAYGAYDEYEGKIEPLGKFQTKREAEAACKRREKETDGECYCYILDLATGERVRR